MDVQRWSAIPGPHLQFSRAESEATQPIYLPQLLSKDEIALVEGLGAACIVANPCAENTDESSLSLFDLPDDGAGFHAAAEDALHGLLQHRVVHLHGVAALQQESCGLPALERKLVAAMKANDSWGLTMNRETSVRSFEFHAYTDGGSVLDPEHRDDGSLLTLSVLLSPADDFQGGTFITYEANETVEHPLEQGDGILFVSEKRHGVEVVHGRRRALILELWAGPRNQRNRHS
jgi:hypothetical protein